LNTAESPEDIDSTVPREVADRNGPDVRRHQRSACHAGGWINTPAGRLARPMGFQMLTLIDKTCRRRERGGSWPTPWNSDERSKGTVAIRREWFGADVHPLWVRDTEAGRRNLTYQKLPRNTRSHLNVHSSCSFVYILEIQLDDPDTSCPECNLRRSRFGE